MCILKPCFARFVKVIVGVDDKIYLNEFIPFSQTFTIGKELI